MVKVLFVRGKVHYKNHFRVSEVNHFKVSASDLVAIIFDAVARNLQREENYLLSVKVRG